MRFRFPNPASPSPLKQLSLAATLTCLAVSSPSAPAAGDSVGNSGNPLLERSPLPLEYPQFDRIKAAHFLPAFEITMPEHLEEVAAIANSDAEPTFENTLVALERAGRRYNRTRTTFSNLVGTIADDDFRAIEKTMAPKHAAHTDAIRMNGRLFKRIEALHQSRDQLGLDAESKRLIERYHKDFVRAGARLAEADKERLRAINQRLAALETSFAQNVQKESNASAIVVDDKAELAGLPENEIAAAEAAAKAAGKTGKYLIRLLNTSGQPVLASLENRALRQRIHEASVGRCSQGGEYDNRAIVAELVRLRAEKAALLGFPTHATFVLADQTAGTPDRVNTLLANVAKPAVINARREAADMQALLERDAPGARLAAWDWDYYSEKVRKARYAFDEAQLKPYLEVNNVLVNGVFFAANKLYGITFKERRDLPIYEPSVRVWDIFEADGSHLAIFITDFYARPSKRGGAWMNSYVSQSALLGTRPVVANHLNLTRPSDGQPTLLSFDEVITMFHEFGHGLHGLFSKVRYPRFAGTQVPRDFVEFPSQVNEMWAIWPEVVSNYAKHHQTGAPMPKELLDKLLATQKFNQGFRTTEYLAATLLDQAWHQLKPEQVPNTDGVLAFEAEALRRAGVALDAVPPRYRSTYFVHVFKNDYSAGYYSYIWAEVLDAEGEEWFKQNGGLTRANGDRLRRAVLSRGGSVDAMQMFVDFAGRQPKVDPLLKRRGLDAATEAPAAP